MLRERETAEEAYAVHIAALREQIQDLLDDNQLEEAKAVKEKKELLEAVYIPYPTWPFNVKAKLFSTSSGLVEVSCSASLLPCRRSYYRQFQNPI